MTPPPSADWHAKCPADGDALSNDKYGCCVEVADSRIIQMRKAVMWGDATKPLVSDILGRYTALTGFNLVTGQPDNGTDTVADMQSWCTHGIRISDQTLDVPYWSMAHPTDQNEVNLAIAHTGPVAITMLLPIGAQDLSSTLAILRWSCGVAEGVCYAISQAAWEFLHVWEFAGD
jgi:hypothetical protein